MEEYLKKYKKVIDGLIKKSFPKLKDKKIFISEVPNFKKWNAGVWYFIFFNWILVCKKVRDYPIKELKALFAHELGHIEYFENLNLLEKMEYGLKWLFSKKIRAEFETKTDSLVIKKGYGKELLKLVQRGEKIRTKGERLKRKEQGYLTSNQIKKLIKE